MLWYVSIAPGERGNLNEYVGVLRAYIYIMDSVGPVERLRSTCCCCVTRSPQIFSPLLDKKTFVLVNVRGHHRAASLLSFKVEPGIVRPFLLSFLSFKSTLWVQMMHQLNQILLGSWVFGIQWLESMLKTSHPLHFSQHEYDLATRHPFSVFCLVLLPTCRHGNQQSCVHALLTLNTTVFLPCLSGHSWASFHTHPLDCIYREGPVYTVQHSSFTLHNKLV